MRKELGLLVLVILFAVGGCFSQQKSNVEEKYSKANAEKIIRMLCGESEAVNKKGVQSETQEGIYVIGANAKNYYPLAYFKTITIDQINLLIAEIDANRNSSYIVLYNKAINFYDYKGLNHFMTNSTLASDKFPADSIVINRITGKRQYAYGSEINTVITSADFTQTGELTILAINEYRMVVNISDTLVKKIRIEGIEDVYPKEFMVSNGIVSADLVRITNTAEKLTLIPLNENGLVCGEKYEVTLAAVDEKLLAYYKFDGNVNDSTTNLLNGTIVGNPTFTTGRIGRALDFNGRDDYIRVPATALLNTQITSISAWIQSDNGARTCAYFRKDGGYHIRTSNGQLDIVIESGYTFNSGYNIPATGWHHYVVIVNNEAGTVEFYVDGEKRGVTHTYANKYNPNQGDIFIGQFGNGYRWDGRIDEVKIFGKALSASDIQRLFVEGSAVANLPAAPGNLSASASENSIVLNWRDNADNETGYRVEKSVSGGAFEVAANIAANETSYTDANVIMGQSYSYRVTAFNAIGTSDSVTATVTIAPEKPATPFAYYKLDGNGNDLSGNNMNGTIVGNLAFVTGKVGSAGDFNALDSYVNIDTNQSVNLEKFSVEAWLQSDNGGRTCAYINVPGIFHIRTSGNQWDIVLDSAGWATIQSGYQFKAGEWHHHVVTVDNTTRTVEFYVDGVKVGNSHSYGSAMGNQITNFKAYIGQFNSDYMWDGRIDEVRFFSKKLTTTEIQGLYAEGNIVVPVPASPSNLTAVANGNSVVLNWADNANNETGYRVEKSTGSATFEVLTTLAANAVSYTDTNITAGQTYSYRVTAFNGKGSSESVTQQITIVPPVQIVAPFAYYKLDGNGNDSSGNNMNGTIVGNLAFVAGQNGSAGDFNSVDSYVNIDTNQSVNLEKFSVEAWLQSDNGGRTCAYINVPGIFHIRTSGNQWDLVLDSAGWANIQSGYQFTAGEWHHHVVTVDNTTRSVEFYVDGAKVGDTHTYGSVMGNQISNFRAYIGQFSSGYMWDGRMDEVKFYNVQLSATEIAAIYSGTNIVDNESPSVPQNLTAGTVTPYTAAFLWNGSTDNTAVAGYRIYRGNVQVGETSATSFQDNNLSQDTAYVYTVVAFDRSGNLSSQSQPLSIRTLATGNLNEIVFVTEGSSFSPVITVTGNPTVRWTWADNTTSNSLSPSKEYGSVGKRVNRLIVDPWSALVRINIGYDRGDGGTSQIESVPNQNVSSVQGLEITAPYLRQWCSSYNRIESLDFTNFINLDTIECFLSSSLRSVNLTNTPSLRRACFEDCSLQSLDLSGCPNLEDLRGAVNEYTGINFGNTRERVWHICVRDNPQMTQPLPSMVGFNALRELFIWNTNQSGELEVTSPVMGNVAADNNKYTSADFSAARFNGWGSIEMNYNRLTSINVANCEGIRNLSLNNNSLTEIDITGITTIRTFRANNNSLTQNAVENILHILDLSGVTGGTVELTGANNGGLNSNAITYAQSLRTKGWTVNTNN